MYTEYYGLKEKPFSIIPNPEQIFKSSNHILALTYLEYGVRENVGFILLTGDIGSGKTTLIQHLLKGCAQELEVAMVFNTNVTPDELIKLILTEYEISPIHADKSANIDKLNSFLIEQYARRKRVLLVIDEAQNLSREALEEVRMLSNLQTEHESLLQIILAGQPELRRAIHEPWLEQLAQRIAVTYHLGPLDKEEAKAYIRYRLQSAGCARGDLFDDQAMECIYEQTKGIPRSINILCDASLVYGFADDVKIISQELVEQVIEDREVFNQPTDVTQAQSGSEYVQPHTGQDVSNVHFLEAKVERLAAQVESQHKEIATHVQAARQELIRSLEAQIRDERKKYEKLLLLYGQLRKQMQHMEQGKGTSFDFSVHDEALAEKKNGSTHIGKLLHFSESNGISGTDEDKQAQNEVTTNFAYRASSIAIGALLVIVVVLIVIHTSYRPLDELLRLSAG